MQERYNRQEVNCRHAVYFSKPKANDSLYYFDFKKENWIQCQPRDNLPYGLCSYHLDSEPESDVVVTATDSYRLIEDLDNAPDLDEMIKEREWREQIVHKDA